MIFKTAAVFLLSITPVCTVTTPIPTRKPTSNPSAKPTFQVWSGAGCPHEWIEGADYKSNDLAASDGVVYKCSGQDLLFVDLLCGLSSYKPGDSLYWEVAWTRLGSCTGSISPTTSPAYVGLTDAGGCPEEFTESVKYGEGDQVQVNNIVLQCKDWPYSVYCNMEGFEPLGSKSDMGWEFVGHCEGTVTPTTAPVFVHLQDHNGCPEPYDSNSEYDASDKVSTNHNDSPFSIVWQCSSDVHNSRYCQLFEPGNEFKLGWAVIGHCDGTMSPTTAPNFMQLIEFGEGCPDEYESDRHYETGDTVSNSLAPDRKLVYQCKEWPHSAYCNAGTLYAPGAVSASLGWEVKGWCSGTAAPTSSPIQLTDSCEEDPWSLNDISFYKEGDRVRKADRIYECKTWPYSIRCRDAYYEPESSAHWDEAWMYVGKCQGIEIVDVVSVSIEGTLSIDIDSRRSLLSVEGLDDSETNDLIISAQEAIEDVACSNLPDDYICTVEISSVNEQPVTRRLRTSKERNLAAGFIFQWTAQIIFDSATEGEGLEGLVNEISSTVSHDLNAAVADNSLIQSLVSKASTNAVQSINFRAASVHSEAPRIELRKITRKKSPSGAPTPKPTRKAEFCLRFNDPKNLDGFAPCPGDYNNIGVRHSTSIRVTDNAINPLSGDTYLHLMDYIYDSIACGRGSEYTGDWTIFSSPCHELCFDITMFYDCCNSEVSPSIILQGGAPHYYRATFKAYDTMTAADGSRPGWRRICAPINTLGVNGNLPSNDEGFWIMNTPHNVLSGSKEISGASRSANSTWNNLLSNITAIILPVDYTSRASERVGYDNICLEESTCPTNAPTTEPTSVPTLSPTVECKTSHVTMNSPLNNEKYLKDIFNNYDKIGPHKFCYNAVLASIPGGPTTAQLLVMFRENFVEHRCKVYASLSSALPFCDHPERKNLLKGGLYEVIDEPGACVTFRLLYEDDTLGQIVASSQFDPIEVIGISGSIIHGYYPGSSPGGSWSRKTTLWGDAIDGSLTAEPVLNGEVALVSGLSSNGRLFNLWGSFSNFNYAKHDDIVCSARPAGIDDWTGFFAGSRGVYCPNQSNSQLTKYTWHSSGSITTSMGWTAAKKIGRLSPASNIFGISSTDGKVITLWDEVGVAVHSIPLDLGSDLTEIQAIGGVDNGYARGVFAINDKDRVYNVYWDGDWKAKELALDYGHVGTSVSAWFGNYNDQTYILYGHQPDISCGSCNAWYSLYQLDFVGGEMRHSPVRVAYGEVAYSDRSNICSSDSPSVSPSVTLSPSITAMPSSPPSNKPTRHREFCATFNNPADLEGFAPCPGIRDNIFLKHSTDISPNNDDPINPLTNDTYLHLKDDDRGSLACGTDPSYLGDWNSFTCHELCFDVNLFHDGCHSTITECTANYAGKYFIDVYPSLFIQGGAPKHYRATFKAHQPMTDVDGSSPGWRRICAPIGPLDSNGNLPSNEFGHWEMNAPFNIMSGGYMIPGTPVSDNTTWPILLSDITAIMLPVDFTGNPAERVGYDNICMESDSRAGSVGDVGSYCGTNESPSPSFLPSSNPSISPSENPSPTPSEQPSLKPSTLPSSAPSFVHTEFCNTFNDPSDLQGFAPCPGIRDNIIVEHSTNISPYNDDPINPLTKDTYLHLRDDSGTSLACGTDPSYLGDWSSFFCHELCFDVNLFYDGCHSGVSTCTYSNENDGYYLNVYPYIYIQGGAPNYYRAAFKVHQPITDVDGSSPGWRRICAPIGPLDSNGNLPSNSQGYWMMTYPFNILSGGSTTSAPASANTTWPTLLSDVTAIMLPVDFTGNPAERIGYDNICMKSGSRTGSSGGIGSSCDTDVSPSPSFLPSDNPSISSSENSSPTPSEQPSLKPSSPPEFCSSFNDPSDLQGFAPCPGIRDNVDVKQSTSSNILDDPINPLTNDGYLHVADGSGGSLVCGTDPSYIGDWSSYTCHKLCFDVSLFHDGCHSGVSTCESNGEGGYFLQVFPSIFLQGGAPNYYRAYFKMTYPITDGDGDNPGWHRICAPIGPLDSDGNLPSNEFGYWMMTYPFNVLSGGSTTSAPASDNTTWPILLTDITALTLPVDFTGNPAERVGYDNICMESDSRAGSVGGVGSYCGTNESPSPSVLPSSNPSISPSENPSLITSKISQSTCPSSSILFSQKSKLISSDGQEGNFGNDGNVDIAYGTVIVGAKFGQGAEFASGAAYIFHQDVNGDWIESAKLFASDGTGGSHFGESVSISENSVAVGAPDGGFCDAGGTFDPMNACSGSVYVFTDDSGWNEEAKLVASDGHGGNRFGSRVSISGNYLIVGASGDNQKGTNAGSAYVFEREGGVWILKTKLLASDGTQDNHFGMSVAISGEYAAVGAPWRNDGTGAVYMFKRNNSSGLWLQTEILLGSDIDSGNTFGWAVDVFGGNLIVGTPHGGNGSNGSAYIFQINEMTGIWNEKATFSGTNNFGKSVCISNCLAVIGSHRSGAFVIWKDMTDNWIQSTTLSGESDFFGVSVGIFGNDIIVGEPGAAYIF